MAETYIVLVPITATYALETEAENARHAKALVLQQLAHDEEILFKSEMSEYEIQWDSVISTHVEKDEMSPGSGFGTDREAELASMLKETLHKTSNALKRSNAQLASANEIIDQIYETLVTGICEAILDDHENLKGMARTMLDTIKNRKK